MKGYQRVELDSSQIDFSQAFDALLSVLHRQYTKSQKALKSIIGDLNTS